MQVSFYNALLCGAGNFRSRSMLTRPDWWWSERHCMNRDSINNGNNNKWTGDLIISRQRYIEGLAEDGGIVAETPREALMY